MFVRWFVLVMNVMYRAVGDKTLLPRLCTTISQAAVGCEFLDIGSSSLRLFRFRLFYSLMFTDSFGGRSSLFFPA